MERESRSRRLVRSAELAVRYRDYLERLRRGEELPERTEPVSFQSLAPARPPHQRTETPEKATERTSDIE